MEGRGDDEIWVRDFDGRRFRSRLRAAGRPGEISETFEPLTFRIRLTRAAGTLGYPVTSGRIGPVPLPRWLLPESRSAEGAEGGAATFDIDIRLPGIGRQVRYRSRIEAADRLPAEAGPAA